MIISDKLRECLEGAVGSHFEVANLGKMIAANAAQMVDDHGDYFDIREGFITYLPKGKEVDDNDIFRAKNRTKVKAGRWLRRIIKENKLVNYVPVDATIEQLAYELCAVSGFDLLKVRVVKGEDIRYWYNEKNYAKNAGTLNQSCMRYSQYSKYFDVYCKNPDVVNLAIIVDQNGKLIARALLWKNVDDVWMMDRIYGNDLCRASMHKVAAANGWISIYYGARDGAKAKEVQLDKWDFNLYPSLDSMRYMDWEKGQISPRSFKGLERKPWRGYSPGPGTVSRAYYPAVPVKAKKPTIKEVIKEVTSIR